MLKLFLSAKRRNVLVRSHSAVVESMEPRTMLSVSVNSAGFVTVTPAAGDRVIYVSSSSGNDIYNGTSPSTPVKSLARGISLMRNGTGDELLLKAGDTWNQPIGTWLLTGASTQNPMVIGSYGSGARPTIYSGSNAGFVTLKSPISNLDVIGINFDSNTRDPKLTKTPDTHSSPTGFDFQSGGSNDLVQNCEFQNYAINMNFQNVWGTPTNITVSHNISINAWAIHGYAEGLYALGVHGLTLTGNDFDHNGYSDTIPYATASVYNQDCYLSYDNTGVVVKDNIFSRAASTGLQDRPGGIVQNNLFINDPVDMNYGLVNGAHSTPGGVTGSVTGNVFMGGGGNGNLAQGIGLEVGNVNSKGAVISNNIFSTGVANGGAAILLTYGSGQSNPSQSVGLNNVTVSNNTIYSWKSGLEFGHGQVAGGSGLTAFNDVKITSNQFEEISPLSVENYSSLYSQEHWSGNVFYKADTALVDYNHARPNGTILSSPISFPADTRSAATYDQTLGRAGTLADFYALEAGQTQQSWNAKLDPAAVVSYISAGFGK